MRQLIVSATTAALFFLATSRPLAAAENAELAALQGKWTTKKTNPDGQTYTQTLEIKKDKLTFKMMGSDGSLRLMAKADLKTEKLGPFNVLKISEIEAGASSTELQAINDDRVNIYSWDDGKLVMASNFDKSRDQQKPGADTYTHETSSK